MDETNQELQAIENAEDQYRPISGAAAVSFAVADIHGKQVFSSPMQKICLKEYVIYDTLIIGYNCTFTFASEMRPIQCTRTEF